MKSAKYTVIGIIIAAALSALAAWRTSWALFAFYLTLSMVVFGVIGSIIDKWMRRRKRKRRRKQLKNLYKK